MSATESSRLPRQRPADILLNILITLLTPMFLLAADGDLTFARLAAAETIDAYRAETHTDLITVAKIIAFGLTALASLCRSMEDDLTISQILRLRSNANAADRAEHRNRHILQQSRSEQAAVPRQDPEPDIDTAALTAAAADMQQRTIQHLARLAPQAPDPAPATQTATNAEQQYAASWAASAAAIAAETAATLPSLPPNERHSAAMWIEALNEAAADFMTVGIPPRLRPGDLTHPPAL
jgi:hypothetical protein